MEHVTIYHKKGRFAAWPANFGIWSWDTEMVTGFFVGYVDPGAHYHARDKSRPFENMQVRSKDGGETWLQEGFPGRTPGGRCLSCDEHMNPGMGVEDVLDGADGPKPFPGGIDFTNQDFALLFAKTGLKAGVRSFFFTSTDRCRSWQGAYRFPMFDQSGIAARTDYIVEGPDSCFLFLTANKKDGLEGRVFCARTADGGRSFQFVSWIGPEPEGFYIMPASVRLSDSQYLVAIRCQGKKEGDKRPPNWIDLYVSEDAGVSWHYLSRPVHSTGWHGNPPTLTRLLDGRLCLTYGLREPPYGMRAKISDDGGNTWGPVIVLREGAGNHDLGYPRTIQRPDGKIVTIYYFNDSPGGERYMAATLWDPPG